MRSKAAPDKVPFPGGRPLAILEANVILIPFLAGVVAQPAAQFTEIGARALPGVATRCGTTAKDFIIEANGGGVVLGEFDGDGNVDLVVVDGSTLERVEKGERGFPPRLFLGRGDGTFAQAGEAWGMSGGRWGMGGAAGDIDGDGWLDLVITEWGPNRVFRNEAGKGFRELTANAGLVGEGWSTSAALLDYDRDGKLDLAIVRYLEFDPKTVSPPGKGSCRWKGHPVMCGPTGLVPSHDQLFRGRGDGTFEEVTLQARFRPAEAGFGLGAMTLDYDDDGDTDLFVTNDSTPNHLWENQGDGTFREVGFRRGVSHDGNGKAQASMGIGCGDWNGDGRDDLFVTTFSGESNALFSSVRGLGFRERSASAGIAGPSLSALGWGTHMIDFDLDGDLDLSVMNGHVYPQADLAGTDTSYAQRDQLYRCDGHGRFTVEDLSDAAACVSRASAWADMDGDGDLDIAAVRVEGPVRVLLNGARRGSGAHWLRVRLRGRASNRDGIGARVIAQWEGGRLQQEIRTSGGFQSAVPAEAHFGLGNIEKLDRLTVKWPSGRQQVLEAVAVNRILVVEEPEGSK